MSTSQIGQDRQVIDKIYNGLRGGYFIELGAGDGITLSNTFILERDYGWNGLCIEPNPDYNLSMQRNRKCHTSTACCLDVVGKHVEFSQAAYKELSGIKDHLNSHRNKVLSNNKSVQLVTTTLNNVLDQFNAPSFIEYLSLDTEGSELLILHGIDFSKYTFGYITVEHNMVDKPRSEIRTFLEAHGMKYYRENKWDDDYIHESVLERITNPN